MTPYLTLCREFVAIDSCAVLIALEFGRFCRFLPDSKPAPAHICQARGTFLRQDPHMSTGRSSHVNNKVLSDVWLSDWPNWAFPSPSNLPPGMSWASAPSLRALTFPTARPTQQRDWESRRP